VDFPQIKYVYEAKRGIPITRNIGIKVAKGSIIMYTDDDCVVHEGWMKNLVNGLRKNPFVVGAGGPIYPLIDKKVTKKYLPELVLGIFDEGQETGLTECLNTGNVAFRREIFDSFKFDETFRRGSDTEFCRELVDTGYKLLYVPNAKVYHRIGHGQIGIPYAIRRAFHYAVGFELPHYRKRLRGSNRVFQRIKTLRYIIGQIIQNYLRFLRRPSLNTLYRLSSGGIFPLLLVITFADLFYLRYYDRLYLTK
jgi:GT2 family glycosyltransferase